MAQVQVATRHGAPADLDGDALGRLELRGELVLPDQAGYDDARTVWNAMIDRRPAVIARCAGAADVLAAVAFAREHELLVSVRGGGHSVAGHAVCDDGLMIDLSPMRSVRVDPPARRAVVEPGVRLRELDHETQAFGLATPTGVISDTGIAGLTLGGGFGLLSRRHGLTVDNLVAADVVTADGRFLRASADEHPDLYWALRGGGGNFGVVTGFELALHPVGPVLYGGLIAYPLEQAREVLRGVARLTPGMPDDLSAQQTILGVPLPPLPAFPESAHGQPVVGLVVVWTGEVADGEAAVAPLHELGEPIGAMVGPMPYVQMQQMGDPLMVPPARNYWGSRYLADLTDEVVDTIVEHVADRPTPSSQVIVHQLGGATARVPVEATAYPHRDARFEVNVQGRWQDPSDDERVVGWARDLDASLAPLARGSYVNTSVGADPDAAQAAFGANHRRLAEVKRAYDPDNVFRCNANIRPAG